MKTVEQKMLKTSDLVPYANNARKHSDAQIMKLRASIREFGFNDPVVVDENFTVMAGHGRLQAAKDEGIEEIPCAIVSGLTEPQKKAYILAANRLALDSTWDEEMLALEMESLQDYDFDLDFTGFTDDELAQFMSIPEEGDDSIHPGLPEDDAYDLTAALEEANFCEAGDIWTVGNHRLICGDSTKPEDIEKLMNGNRATVIVTDPPYNVAIESEHGLKIKNDKMENSKFYEFLENAFSRMADSATDAASIYVFYADSEAVNFRNAFVNTGFYLAETLIWNKNNLTLGRSDYHWKHEPILYGWKKGCAHKWYNDRKQTTVLNFAKPLRADTHPTSKPVDLLSYLIKNSSQEGEIVLDLFGGSGSTLIAAEKTNRRCFMSEYDSKFVSVILRRYVADVGNSEGVFVERGGKTYTYDELAKELNKDGEHSALSENSKRRKEHQKPRAPRDKKAEEKRRKIREEFEKNPE